MSQKSPIYLNFTLKDDYNYSRSSEDNYASPHAPFVGKYRIQRSMLDYNYHQRYSEERQLLHDQLIDLFLETRVKDHRFDNVTCEVPLENWIVFTAGPMGAGKGHTLQWLNRQDLFPLDAFVNVDPDAIRELLPEFDGYNRRNIGTMGYLTQKEVGYISEVLTYDALLNKKNVLVDGSLRDVRWYLEYFNKLRRDFCILRIAIINVVAPIDSVLRRAHKRALVTGRMVPDNLIIESAEAIPVSVSCLARNADFHARISNEDGVAPYMEYCCMRDKETKLILWTLELQNDGDYIFKDHVHEKQRVEESWEERFAEVWVMQCELDNDKHNAANYGHYTHFHKERSDGPVVSPRPDVARRSSIRSWMTFECGHHEHDHCIDGDYDHK